MNVKEYHELGHLSSSRIKLFVNDRHKFKKWKVDGVKPKDKKTISKTVGSVTDFFLLRDVDKGLGDEKFDDVFALYTGKTPGGQFGEVVNELYNITLDNTNEAGEVTKSFDEMLEEAYDNVAYDKEGNLVKLKTYKSFETFAKAFSKEGVPYYKFMRENSDQEAVTIKELETSKAAADKAMNSWVTKDIFRMTTAGSIEVINQFAYTFKALNTDIKILIDKVIIDHDKKVVIPYELKTIYNQDAFETNFWHYLYYIQLGLYYAGLQYWIKEKGLDYDIDGFNVVALPTTYMEDPLVVQYSPDDLRKFINGFDRRYRYVKGVKELIAEINWHVKQNYWAMSFDDFNNNGIRKFEL